MALAITVTEGPFVRDSEWVTRGTGNLGTYATGGIAYTPKDFGFSGGFVKRIVISPAGGYAFNPDYTNKKILSYTTAATETGAVDLSGVVFNWEASGL